MILCLETSTKACSVALGKDGKILALKESIDEKHSHSENLTVYVQEVCDQAKIKLADISAVAVSKGPGSFTGLRIGVSVAKGLCYALDKPLIGINSLEAMAAGQVPNFSPHRLSPNPSPQGEGDSPVYHTTKMEIWEGLKQRAREMIGKPTKAEELLWDKLRNKKTGHKIRRQHSIDKFICDFVCLEKQLVIEVDGGIHKFQKDEDKLREEIIGDKRFSILRFTNEEVLNNVYRVVSEIKNILNTKSPPPLRGGARGGANQSLDLFCPMIDARRMEVYCAVYDRQKEEVRKTSADIIDENSFSDLLKNNKVTFFGDGAEKCRSKITHPNAVFLDNVNPSAQFMLPIAEKYFEEKIFEDVAYFEPFYLKDFVGIKSK